MSNLKVLKIGTEFILEAVSFTQQKNIERSAPSIQWTITPKGGSPEKIGTGKAINYKITDKYAYKEVVFRAFIREDSYKMYPQQCLTCFIEEKVSTEGVLIKKVGKSGSEKVGGTIECKVTQYNKPFDKITEAQKRAIKWDVKVGDREKKVFTTDKNEPYRGETIKFIVPKSWSGKNVILMPYLNQSTEKRPNSAKDYDKFLPTIGFSTVATEEYTPQKGDIVVIQNIDNHPHGHIAMYDGEHWISDFEQRDFWGGQSNRTIKPKHTFFRWKQ